MDEVGTTQSQIVEFMKAQRDTLEKMSGIRFPKEDLDLIFLELEKETPTAPPKIKNLINSYSRYFLYTSLENSFSKDETQKFSNYILFFYNLSLAFKESQAKKELEFANKIMNNIYSLFDQIEVMKTILNVMNRNILASRIEFDAAPNFLSIIRGGKKKEKESC